MFQIKICGITSVDDAVMVTRAGADAIGLNFYTKSPRFVTTQVARQIAESVPSHVTKVGLFVNAPVDEVCRTFDDLGLALIQLHGDEPAEFVAQMSPRPVMRAFRIGPDRLSPVFKYLDQCSSLGHFLHYVLLDAFSAGSYGGTGVTTDWTLAAEYAQKSCGPSLTLAGGLVPRNVAEAIRTVRPMAVDVASGVESSPGRKDPLAVAAFVEAARAAFRLPNAVCTDIMEH